MVGSYDSNVASVKGSYDDAATMSGSLSFQIVNTDYEELNNLPTINGVLVKGDLTQQDLKIERGYDVHVDPEDSEHLILTV